MSLSIHTTTQSSVNTYHAVTPVFDGLIKEVRELSRKKPEATMNPNKIKMINRVLDDLLTILKDEPTGKYLELLDDEILPQVSDAVLIMVQFETALDSFKKKYFRWLGTDGGHHWITTEFAEVLDEDDIEEYLENLKI